MSEIQFLIAIFFVLSFIQSVFGVGLLIFGTPTLLLYGYSYEDTLQLLLPSSLVISTIQVYWSKEHLRDVKNTIVMVVPTLVMGLLLILYFGDSIDIKRVVGAFLIIVWLIRSSELLRGLLLSLVKRHKYIYISVMGFIHGLSNMGGGLLTNLMLSLHHNKNQVRVNIAMVYMIFASSQLIVLFMMSRFNQLDTSLLLIVVSITSYLLFGRYIANRINDRSYHLIISIIILAFGLLSFLT
jgi:uncharacterized protein